CARDCSGGVCSTLDVW
nr:immunoglobulin heavy chain junction region [Macaca mulatta]MOV91007.1 immunoglobulin heavy chain junction region [Macaca mulatta]